MKKENLEWQDLGKEKESNTTFLSGGEEAKWLRNENIIKILQRDEKRSRWGIYEKMCHFLILCKSKEFDFI